MIENLSNIQRLVMHAAAGTNIGRFSALVLLSIFQLRSDMINLVLSDVQNSFVINMIVVGLFRAAIILLGNNTLGDEFVDLKTG
jgi:hypothetical protein